VNFLRTDLINASLEKSLTRERLEKYLSDSGDKLDDALTLYERNMRLSEAFYTPLQCMEVCLRNKLNEQLVNRYGENWFQNGSGAQLGHDAYEQIDRAKTDIKKPVITPDDIIASLHLGFWVALLAKRYDATLWRNALHKAFRSGSGKRRDDVHGRFNALRRFRNRVAHHEPIFVKDLVAVHAEVIEAIRWMCPNTANWAEHHSRVIIVLEAS
jgi:IS5 family transposase